MVVANLGSNWQKRALGLSVRLLTPPRLSSVDENSTTISETIDQFHFKQVLFYSVFLTSQHRRFLKADPIVCSIPIGVESEASAD